MTTRINFFIVIVIFIVSLPYSSSVPKCTSETYTTPNYPSSTEKSHTRPVCKGMWEEIVCGRGTEDKNSTRIPKCSESCDNGNRTEPKVCSSNENCGEDFRNVTLICLIAHNRPNQRSDSKAPGRKDGETATVASSQEKSAGPQECPSELCAQCNNITSFNITHLESTTYCWTHIQSPCIRACASEIDYWKLLIEYKYTIGGTAIGIISLMVVVCICCIVRRKIKPSSTRENIPLQSKYPEYMEDNAIYS